MYHIFTCLSILSVKSTGLKKYKGNAKYNRSIGQNILTTSKVYNYKNGYFGVKGQSADPYVRNIFSENPLKTANDFYDRIAIGGEEEIIQTSKGTLRKTKMHDGTLVIMRNFSTSDGTPVVEINIKRSTHYGDIKDQKIHFCPNEYLQRRLI